MKRKSAETYLDGAVVRGNNIRLSIQSEKQFKDGKGNLITITKLHTEEREKVLCRYEILKGKYVTSQIALTDDALYGLHALLSIEIQRRINTTK